MDGVIVNVPPLVSVPDGDGVGGPLEGIMPTNVALGAFAEHVFTL